MQSQIDQIKPFLNSSKSILIAAGAGIELIRAFLILEGRMAFGKLIPLWQNWD